MLPFRLHAVRIATVVFLIDASGGDLAKMLH